MIKITVSLPPPIIKYFSHLLLNTPYICFGDNLERLEKILLFIINNLLPKAKNNPQRLKKCNYLITEIKDIHERTKAKEKELETKTIKKPKQPFYRITCSKKCFQCLYERMCFR